MPDSETSGYEVIVGEGRKGAGLFATRGFAPGAPLFHFDYWSRPVMPMHSTNHSCDPNAAFDPEGRLRALRAIAPHEEITYDYLLNPIPAAPWNFECACGARDCKGWIDAVRDLAAVRVLDEKAELALTAEAVLLA